MWTVRVSALQLDYIYSGKQIEIMVSEGVLIVEADGEGIKIGFLNEKEAGLRFGRRFGMPITGTWVLSEPAD